MLPQQFSLVAVSSLGAFSEGTLVYIQALTQFSLYTYKFLVAKDLPFTKSGKKVRDQNENMLFPSFPFPFTFLEIPLFFLGDLSSKQYEDTRVPIFNSYSP